MTQMEFSCHLLPPPRHLPCSRKKPEQCPIPFLVFTQIYSMRKTCQFPPNYLISGCFSPSHLLPLWFQLPPAPPWTSAKPLAAPGVTFRLRSFSGSLCLVLIMSKLALHNQTLPSVPASLHASLPIAHCTVATQTFSLVP